MIFIGVMGCQLIRKMAIKHRISTSVSPIMNCLLCKIRRNMIFPCTIRHLLYTSRIRGSMNVIAISTTRLTRENMAAVTTRVDCTRG